MHQFTGSDGAAVWVRSVRVAVVRELAGGTHIYFPGGEDPVLVTGLFAAVVSALQPEIQVGLLVLAAEEGAIAINPRYVLSVAASAAGGARVAMSGGRDFDVTQALDDVVSALQL